MKIVKGVFGCILALIFALLIQGVVVLVGSVVYGGIQGFILGVNGTDPGEIAVRVQSMITPDIILGFQTIGSVFCAAVFALWYYKWLGKKNRPSIKKVFEGKTLLWIALLSIGTQLGIMIIMNILVPLFPGTFAEYEKHIGGLGMGTSLISFIYVGLIAPISEEFIFRGIIFNKGKKVMPFMYANILQAFLFGVIHGNIVQGTYAFALGLLMGLIYEKRQSIFAPIALHMGVNMLGILVASMPENFLETYKFVEIILLLIPIPAVIIGIMQISKNPVIIKQEVEDIEKAEEVEEVEGIKTE